MKKVSIALMLFFALISFLGCEKEDEDMHVNYYEEPCSNFEVPDDAPKTAIVDYYFPYQLDAEKSIAASIVLDSKDKAHIAYFIYGSDKAELRYATNKDGKWQIIVLDSDVKFADISDLTTAIAIDSQEAIHIVYTETEKRESYAAHYLRYLTNTSGQWTQETIEENGDYSFDSSLMTTYKFALSVLVDPKNVVHLSYRARLVANGKFVNSTFRHAWRTKAEFSQKWQLEDLLDTGGKDVKIYPSQIAMDSKGNLYIAYCHGGTKDIGYITNNNPDKIWGTKVLAEKNCIDQSPSLVIDSNDIFHVAYAGKDLNGQSVVKYGNNKELEWKFYVVKKGVEPPSLNLAANGNNVLLIYYVGKELSENEVCGLPAGKYLKVYSDLGPSSDFEFLPYLTPKDDLLMPLRFFVLDKKNWPQIVIGDGKNGLQFIDSQIDSLEGELTYSEPQDCNNAPDCLLSNVRVICEIKEEGICKERYTQINKWNWPGGKTFKSVLISPAYIFPDEIPDTTCYSSDCGVCYPCCVSEKDCDDGIYCNTDVCLPEQVCSHQPIDDCCESDEECEDGDYDTVDQCVDHECKMECKKYCDGKECGSDGCVGSCGECYGQDKCVDGQCICQSDCYGKQCGDDGCGGSCGECAQFSNSFCNYGKCDCDLDCNNKQCGDDGCGGTCGECSLKKECNFDGQCVCLVGCGSGCCDLGKICTNPVNCMTEFTVCCPTSKPKSFATSPGIFCCLSSVTGFSCGNPPALPISIGCVVAETPEDIK